MPDVIRIQDIAQHVGEEVALQGWLYNKTGKGRLQFLQVRDGSGICQAVVFKRNVSPEDFDAAKALTLESSLRVTGRVKAEERAPGVPGVGISVPAGADAVGDLPRLVGFELGEQPQVVRPLLLWGMVGQAQARSALQVPVVQQRPAAAGRLLRRYDPAGPGHPTRRLLQVRPRLRRPRRRRPARCER